MTRFRVGKHIQCTGMNLVFVWLPLFKLVSKTRVYTLLQTRVWDRYPCNIGNYHLIYIKIERIKNYGVEE